MRVDRFTAENELKDWMLRVRHRGQSYDGDRNYPFFKHALFRKWGDSATTVEACFGDSGVPLPRAAEP